MKTKKIFQIGVLTLVLLAALFYPGAVENASAGGGGDTPTVTVISPTFISVYTGKYRNVALSVTLCDGSTAAPGGWSAGGYGSFGFGWGTPIKKYSAVFSDPVFGTGSETISGWTGACGTPKPKSSAHCSSFNIASRVPQSPAVPVSFKGSSNIDEAEIYFKKLGYSIPLYLYKYDGGSGTWYGFLNTNFLPLGKHSGRVNTYVDGVRGSGCITRGFKVVDE